MYKIWSIMLVRYTLSANTAFKIKIVNIEVI